MDVFYSNLIKTSPHKFETDNKFTKINKRNKLYEKLLPKFQDSHFCVIYVSKSLSIIDFCVNKNW